MSAPLPTYLPAQEIKPNRGISYTHYEPLWIHLQARSLHTTVTKSEEPIKYNVNTMFKVRGQKGQSWLTLWIKWYRVLQVTKHTQVINDQFLLPVNWLSFKGSLTSFWSTLSCDICINLRAQQSINTATSITRTHLTQSYNFKHIIS